MSRLPDLSSDVGKEWDVLLEALTEFCECSLEQCVSRQLIEAGDEEHIARVR